MTFAANYYMAVFELTQRQWECVAGQYGISGLWNPTLLPGVAQVMRT